MRLLCAVILLFAVESEALTIDQLIVAATEFDDDGKTVIEVNPSDDYQVQGVPGEYVKVELDMILPLETWLAMDEPVYDLSTQSGRQKRKAVKSKRQLWPDIIPYIIDERFSADEKLEIISAIHHWMLYTCVLFKEAVATKDFDIIKFVPLSELAPDVPECSSHVGMRSGTQPITLSKGCRVKAVVIHEIGHAIGLYHEHMRVDRDDYLTINWHNIIENQTENFRKLNPNESDNYSIPYDYDSVMHYGKDFMSIDLDDKLVTMEPKNISYLDTIGKTNVASFRDIQIVSAMYQCDSGCKYKQCPDEAFLGKGCACWCKGNGDEPVVKCDMKGRCGRLDIDLDVYNVSMGESWKPVDLTQEYTFSRGTILNVDFRNMGCGDDFKELVCINGSWYGDPPACRNTPCVIPSYDDIVGPAYSYYFDSDHLAEGESIEDYTMIRVSCKFIIPGDNWDYESLEENDMMDTYITCVNGTWDGGFPQNCPPEPTPCNIANGDAVNGSFYSGYSVSCDEGYELGLVHRMNLNRFYCSFDGTWEAPPPVCMPKSCRLPPEMYIAGVIITKKSDNETVPLNRGYDVRHNDTVTQLCPNGHYPPESVHACVLGAWNTEDGKFPLCKAVFCPTPPPVTSVSFYPVKKAYMFGDTLDINRCIKNKEFVGDDNIRCQGNGTWSGTATCRIFCEGGTIQMIEQQNKKINANGKVLQLHNFDKCKKRCQKYKRFLCRSVTFGVDYVANTWKCILHRQDPVENPRIIGRKRKWTIAYRKCIPRLNL